MWLIIGLGNPGGQYARTRHNLGFRVVELLGARYNIPLTKVSLQSLWGQGLLDGVSVVLAQPTTYMNLSGEAAARLIRYFRLTPEQLIVVHDDLDVPFGRLKLVRGGGAGGHRGIKSIQEHLATADFYRVKLGIGRPPALMNPEEFVLAPFAPEEQELAAQLVERASQAVVVLATLGLAAAQNQFHRLSPEISP
uniref:Peptidyl-tRNA hydrolase n=1 Tax=Desulfobacca acetoxidans TaxID=60893 RepID=A0A7V6A3T9_9BACT